MNHVQIEATPLPRNSLIESADLRGHQLHRLMTTKNVDPQEQLRQEIYGNNYLEELVFVGASTDVLYGDLDYRQKFGSCFNLDEDPDCIGGPLLNLLERGFRYFELAAHFDPETRFYYWNLPRDRKGQGLQRREMSRDVREICPFARNHSGEMFIFSFSFCFPDCNLDAETSNDDVRSFLPNIPDQWTDVYMEPAGGSRTQQVRNKSFYLMMPSFKEQPRSTVMNSWFSNEEPPVENPTASRFFGIVASFVKNCALLADVPLTRTVSEMLALRRNVIFTVRNTNLLVPLALQRIFRRDEILRKTIWSDGNIGNKFGRTVNFEWLFPELEETKNLRFFTQPSTLSHLRLVFTDSRKNPWFSKWRGVVVFPSGCTVFDVSLVLLMACLLLMVLKSSLRRSALNGMRFDHSAGKVYPLKKFSFSSSSSSLGMLYLLYAIFFVCFLLANLYAYQCFPRVIMPFSHQELEQTSTSKLNLSNDFNHPKIFSNSTLAQLSFRPENLREEVCNSIVWTFRRWIGRPYGKRVNIISAVTKHSINSSPESSSLLSVLQDQSVANLSLLGVNEFDVCAREFLEFARRANYNQLQRHVLMIHSGLPLSEKRNREFLDRICRPIRFVYMISHESENLLTGTMEEGDEVIFEEGNFPKNSKLRVQVMTRNASYTISLYSELLENLMKGERDLFLRGGGYGLTSESGFAYVSNRSDMTYSSCRVEDLPRSSDVLRVTSWST